MRIRRERWPSIENIVSGTAFDDAGYRARARSTGTPEAGEYATARLSQRRTHRRSDLRCAVDYPTRRNRARTEIQLGRDQRRPGHSPLAGPALASAQPVIAES